MADHGAGRGSAAIRAGLPGRLLEIYRARGDAVVFLKGDGDLEFSRIAQVIDIAKGAGLSRVALTVR